VRKNIIRLWEESGWKYEKAGVNYEDEKYDKLEKLIYVCKILST
jgi:hypothetical protein